MSQNIPGGGVSLREHIERVFTEREKATELFAKNIEDRLSHLNALREDVLRDRSQFASKEMHSSLMDRVYKVEAFQARMIGMGLVLVVVVGIAGAMLAKVFGK